MPKILVIEDEDQILETLLELLKLEKFDVLSAANGLIGVQLAKAERPDLILCDVMMPELDGYGVLEQLRQDPKTAMIPFIFLTARAERLDLRRGMELGADDYLTKPFSQAELKKAIAARLQRQTVVIQQYQKEHDLAKKYQSKAEENQTIVETQEDFLKKLILELRNPVSNINIAIQMLDRATSDEERDRYLTVLKEECAREIALLDQMAKLQELLTPSNVKLLRQFQLLR
jgi:two-component system, OmpR family, alkaline phosphatase synthesis response regulator PhoP